MSHKEAKALRKATRYNAKSYLAAFRKWPRRNRFGLCWWLMFGNPKNVE